MISSPVITVSGALDDPSATINFADLQSFKGEVLRSNPQDFAYQIPLNPGPNVFKLVAINKYGISTEAELVVFYDSSAMNTEEIQAATVASDSEWYFPNVASTDMLDLFSSSSSCSNPPSPDNWPGARAKMKVFMFSRCTEVNDGATCGSDTLRNLRINRAFCKLKGWGKNIAVASAVITPPGACSDISGNINGAKNAVRNIECNSNSASCCTTDTQGSPSVGCAGRGGQVSYIDMDEPWFRASKAPQNCNQTMATAASLVLSFMNDIHNQSDLADIQIGLTEPYPSFKPPEIQTWVNTLSSVGAKPAFFHLDVDPNANLSTLATDMQQLKSYFAGAGVNIPFGVIYTGKDNQTNCTYFSTAIDMVTRTKNAIGDPTHSLFMSFADAPGGQIPINLTECNTCSHTRIINDGISILEGRTVNASFVSQSVPTTMTRGSNQQVTVTMNNTGRITWQDPGTDALAMHTYLTYTPQLSPPCSGGAAPNGWGVQLPGVTFPPGSCGAPGVNYSFTFTITAPTTPGSYQFRWRMGKEDINGMESKFGAASTSVCITVT